MDDGWQSVTGECLTSDQMIEWLMKLKGWQSRYRHRYLEMKVGEEVMVVVSKAAEKMGLLLLRCRPPYWRVPRVELASPVPHVLALRNSSALKSSSQCLTTMKRRFPFCGKTSMNTEKIRVSTSTSFSCRGKQRYNNCFQTQKRRSPTRGM